jgi:hypothetical protein
MDLDAVNEKVEEDFYTFLGTAHARYEIGREISRNENVFYMYTYMSIYSMHSAYKHTYKYMNIGMR